MDIICIIAFATMLVSSVFGPRFFFVVSFATTDEEGHAKKLVQKETHPPLYVHPCCIALRLPTPVEIINPYSSKENDTFSVLDQVRHTFICICIPVQQQQRTDGYDTCTR